jgi:hypothetical protein
MRRGCVEEDRRNAIDAPNSSLKVRFVPLPMFEARSICKDASLMNKS